ncbi:hypothetical protein KC332_g52 [Hortaea werneckii]|nr:hypothetical protein KC332_g52 [Hortaea werneckii]
MRTSLTPNSFSVVFCLNPWVAGSQQKVVRRCMVVDVSRRFASAFQSLKRHYPRIYTSSASDSGEPSRSQFRSMSYRGNLTPCFPK